ncbi:hypothetical protein [Paracoccus sp. S3-43]|uniref:hypothetical protein n=1 Tax=Paracoccus sp. S3-43 TaxID=3030011 RepID=UPI0023B07794|nr:hypothetical protein [Paracoccus sp. S3-43]WEF25689.1 hypothetical protein PXD02_07185 [Paracoccus sp. S3-43]
MEISLVRRLADCSSFRGMREVAKPVKKFGDWRVKAVLAWFGASIDATSPRAGSGPLGWPQEGGTFRRPCGFTGGACRIS